jgi:formate hydrogenlyase subunit 3/multisubunit Na+/H+ antiporter MnhD subunit
MSLRVTLLNTSTKYLIFFKKLTRLFLPLVLFYLFSSFCVINYLLDAYCSHYVLADFTATSYFVLPQHLPKFFELNSTSIMSSEVYVYPFIYVFIIVTTLSIIFCLTYNSDELSIFMFYCCIILFAGYILFFTDSFIIFFFSYEMLLIPSFFILYKFAKTRRAVEAAYLMFF